VELVGVSTSRKGSSVSKVSKVSKLVGLAGLVPPAHSSVWYPGQRDCT
jgi:hypothetical protein